MKRALLMVSVALVFAPACAGKSKKATATTIYLLRHAEKAPDPGDGNPPLSAQGNVRAQALLPALAGVDVVGIYASQYARTQQTVAPLASDASLTVEIVDAADHTGLAERLKSDFPGKHVVACGHSNTVPSIAAALGVGESITIADSQYGDLWVVTIKAGVVTLQTRHFGD